MCRLAQVRVSLRRAQELHAAWNSFVNVVELRRFLSGLLLEGAIPMLAQHIPHKTESSGSK